MTMTSQFPDMTSSSNVFDVVLFLLSSLVRDAKLDTNVSNKMLLNAAKCQGCSFYRFWVIKGKPTGGKITHQPD